MSKKVLITGANGDTGRAAVRESIALGLDLRAMVHKKDARSEPLEKLGAKVVVADSLEINTVRAAMEGVAVAYLVWPVKPGLIHATVNFAQAAKETNVKTIMTGRRSMTVGEFAHAHADVLNGPSKSVTSTS
jgi:NAD(P)H dehydrogenase (quinone)